MTKRLLFEAVGWILAAIGAFYIFGDKNTLVIHYILLIVGIIIIIFYIPKNLRGKK